MSVEKTTVAGGAAVRGGPVRRYERLFVGGAWREPRSGEAIESVDPATGEVWAVVPAAGRDDVEDAVRAARTAFESQEWRRTPGADRGRMLRTLGELIADRSDELAVLETRDNGKAIRETGGRELPGVPDWLDYFAGIADKLHGETIPIGPDFEAYTLREPVGVVGAILPWNAPIGGIVWKLAPAIAAGNTIVIKPAEYTSVTAFEIARLVEQAGFPPGVVNVVSGNGLPAGEALVESAGVDKIAFTGEGATARAITQKSTGNLKRLSFELGGKSANILFEDCDYALAVPAAAEVAFIAAGQSCSLGSRILVQRSIYDRVVADLVDTANGIRSGDPLDWATDVGAQTTLEQLEKIESYVDSARADGAEVLCGGRRATVPGFEDGYFYRPTIIAGVDTEMRVCQEEIFGPVVVVIPFEDEDDAIRIANGTSYGLGAGFWTRDVARTHRLTRALKAGTVWVNTFRFIHRAVPFGGVKMSGYGRENGLEVMSHYTEVKSVVADHRSERDRWFG